MLASSNEDSTKTPQLKDFVTSKQIARWQMQKQATISMMLPLPHGFIFIQYALLTRRWDARMCSDSEVNVSDVVMVYY